MSALAQMPSVVHTINVKVGDTVSENQQVGTVEAMKMEMPIVVTKGGTVTFVAKLGDRVDPGGILVEVE